jgi:sn-glycerol 3-phosphate transport system substrate-binding protein
MIGSRFIPSGRPMGSLAVVVALVGTVACSSGHSGSSGPAPAPASHDLASSCPVGALAKAAQKPVQITMWNSTTQANLAALQKLTNQFNTSQTDVHVNLLNQPSYTDTLNKYKASLSGGERPDVVQIQDIDQQLVIDSRSILPAQACIDAEHIDQSDFLPRILSYYTVQGVQYAVPFSASNTVLYYNKQAFVKAGLDPNKPPTTLDELRTASQKIVSSGVARYGVALKLDSWHLEQWLAMDGQLFVNNDNGRAKRATAVAFDEPSGQAIFSWLSGMGRDKLAESTPNTGFDNLLAVANNVAGMTMETSASLGTILQVLGSGQYKNVTLGVARLPGPVATGSTAPAGSGLFVVANTTPAREEAAWKFTQFLTQPAQQAQWAAATGYVPVRLSSPAQPILAQAWTKNPELRLAYDQLTGGANTPASQGAVIGDAEGVRTAVINAEASLFQGADPTKALHTAAQGANEAISSYEARVGG